MRSSGAYVLVLHLPAPASIRAGRLGPISLDQGHYLYCGSAQAGLMIRLARHMRSEKKMHWHIDFLTEGAAVIGALTFPGGKETECRLAQILRNAAGVQPAVPGFGSSDCGCATHLFHVPDHVPLSMVLDVLRSSLAQEDAGRQSI